MQIHSNADPGYVRFLKHVNPDQLVSQEQADQDEDTLCFPHCQ